MRFSPTVNLKVVFLAAVFVCSLCAEPPAKPPAPNTNVTTTTIHEDSKATTEELTLPPAIEKAINTSNESIITTEKIEVQEATELTTKAPQTKPQPKPKAPAPVPVASKPKEEQIQKPEVVNLPIPEEINPAPPAPASSHNLTLLIVVVAVIGCYLCVHNKSKILGLIVEGRAGRGTSRRGGNARYRRLSTNDAEVESGL
uniref:Flocculation protein FLO11-like n=1 Tax=Panagrellus redivivus TaxID=6233 RepID=A0A7E4W452_PANRE